MKYNAGDKVRVNTEQKDYTGIIMPSESSSFMIKLDNGYNVGIEKKKIKSITLLEKHKSSKSKKTKIKKDPKKPTIAILHTGGTIASKVDYKTGGVIAQFSPEDLISMFPEMFSFANIESHLVSNRMSEDFNFQDYKNIIQAIKTYYNKVDGIIIGHGTDTLGYTAAALAFGVEEIGIPIILVGSQRSSDRGSSDAAENLINAAFFIAKSDFAGVAICMHENMSDNNCLILPPTKTRKLHTSRRDAFKPVNDKAIAKVNFRQKNIDFIKKEYPKRAKKKPIIKDKFEDKVALIKTHPNMNPKQFLSYKSYKGLVIEGTGLGHTQLGKGESIIKAIKILIDSGTIVTMTSQTIFGRVHPYIYTNIRKLSNIGVIYSQDMLSETAFIKLAWLLGNFPKNKVKDQYSKNLRGEINPRILDNEYLEQQVF